jgi:hypothetical protein
MNVLNIAALEAIRGQDIFFFFIIVLIENIEKLVHRFQLVPNGIKVAPRFFWVS